MIPILLALLSALSQNVRYQPQVPTVPSLGHTGFTSARLTHDDAVLRGTWQSCPDADDGSYGERVMVYRVGRNAIGEIHLGPRAEFSVFAGEVEEERDHRSPDNLLGPAHQYDDVATVFGGRNWSIQSLGLFVNVERVPASVEECYAFAVLVSAPKRTLAEQ